MTLSQLKWQKFAGFALPMLLGWTIIGWMFYATSWVIKIDSLQKYSWTTYSIFFLWLIAIPLTAHVMGILSAYCWQYQPWQGNQRQSMINHFTLYFWLFSFPVAIFLVCSVLGIIVFPVQLYCYEAGVGRGGRWIKNRTLDKFWGRGNDWERD